MRNTTFSTVLLATLGALFFTTAGADTAVDLSVSNSALDEIIVTAQRKDEALSKTPVAVTVLSGDSLAKARIVSEEDLQSAVPGLQVRSTLSADQLNYTLRGQSVDVFSGVRPGVLPYFDEIQIGGPGASSAFYDLASIQVLKGPQGTLFGRNATGGAVLFTSNKPSDVFGGYGDVELGNYHEHKFEGALNAPLIGDKLLLRVAAFYQAHDGYQFNLYDGRDVGWSDRTGTRISLAAKFSEQISNDLVFDYLHTNSESMEGVVSGLNSVAFIPISSLYAGTATPIATATGIGTLSAFVPAAYAPLVPGFYTNYFANPHHPATGITGFLATQQANGPFLINTDAPNHNDDTNDIVSDKTTFAVGDNTTVKNIFGFTHLKAVTEFEADGTPYSISQTGSPISNLTKQYSDELQILGKSLDNKLDYIGGVYISSENNEVYQHSTAFDLIFGGSSFTYDYKLKNTTYAGYGHGSYQLNDSGLSVSAGARFTSEKVEDQVEGGDSNYAADCNAAGTAAGFSCDQSKTFNKVSWQFGIEDQLNANLLLYAVTRRSFKSGGFNVTMPPLVGYAATAGNAFLAEQVTDVELGAKFQGHVAEMPAHLFVALYNDWGRDSQRTAYTFITGSPATVTVNVPKSSVYGLEIEGQLKPLDWLTVGGTGTYTHADFSGVSPGATALPGCSGATVIGNAVPSCFDQAPDTPKYTGTIYTDMTLPISGNLATVIHGDVYRQTSSTTSTLSSNSDGTSLPQYTTADFRAGLESTRGGWSVTAGVKNAFNKVYYVGGIPTGTIYQVNTLVPGLPRTYSIQVHVKF